MWEKMEGTSRNDKSVVSTLEGEFGLGVPKVCIFRDMGMAGIEAQDILDFLA